MRKIVVVLFLFFYSCDIFSQCTNNWLGITGQKSGVEIGDLDITGNALTIEAKFNRISPFSGGESYAGDIVSKHTNRLDVNYLLRPDLCQIATNKGFFSTPEICDIDLNKTYYVAMVYDGSTLKFYRNGFLMSQIPASGNLITNNWLTTFGTTADLSNPDVTGLLGYINEVRIWNVPKTQNQLKQYMNTFLPNPTTQTGLLAYYQFSSLKNLQGNATWDGNIKGNANVGQTNPSCSAFVADSCKIIPGCNDWLSTPSYQSYVDIGDLNVFGNQITVEATINRTQPYSQGTGNDNDGDIVSKHLDPTNTNYLLRPNHAYITTSNGFFSTPDVCEIELNKTYHLAMVYDGKTLKYYRNGFLMCQIAATGNLFQNNFPVRIGLYSGTNVENFLGYTNEVRIWDVARTQSQIQQYMNTSLPNPATQPGLLAYYQFNSLTNLQGNAAWNGSLKGSASIGQSNPTCPNFVADSCGQLINSCPPKSKNVDTSFCTGGRIILKTTFTTVAYLWNDGSTNNSLSVFEPGTYSVEGDSAQCVFTDSFFVQQNPLPKVFLGNDTGFCLNAKIILNAGNAGSNYLWQNNTTFQHDTASIAGTYYVRVTDANKCVNSDTIKIYQYQAPAVSIQNINSICKKDSVQLTAISTGSNIYLWTPFLGLSNSNIYNPKASPADTTKYFVTVTNTNKCSTKDSITVNVLPVPLINNLANANICKGSSMQLNAGSSPGNIYVWTPSAGLSNANIYDPLATPSDTTKYFLTVTGSDRCFSKDSVLINVLPVPVLSKLNDTNICKGTFAQLIVNVSGANTYSWTPATGLSNPNIFDPKASPSDTTKYFVVVTASDKCFAKDSVTVNILPAPASVKLNDTSICKGSSVQLNVNVAGNNSYAWFPSAGLSNPNIYDPVAFPSDTIKYSVTVTGSNKCFTKDSIKINVLPDPLIKKLNDTSICKGSSVLLNIQPQFANVFQWQPATGLNNPNSYEPTAVISSSIQYIVIAGNKICNVKDTININALPLPIVSISNDTTICGSAQAQLFSGGGVNYVWSPSAGLSNPNISDPVASPASTTVYTVVVKDAEQCAAKDSVLILVSPKPDFEIDPPVAKICVGDTATFTASGGDTYAWINNSSVIDLDSSLSVYPTSNTTYIVAVTNTACKVKDTLFAQVIINSNPVVTVAKSNDVNCIFGITDLTVTGGTSYSWSPANSLSNANISNPVATPTATTVYYVTVKDNNNCKTEDSIQVNFDKANSQKGYLVPSAFTPNGDGKNDCFSVKEWGNVSAFDLSIYNRWGNLVFHSTNVGGCWDGNYKGTPQPSGTFVYQIKGQAACGEVYRKGTLVLMR